MKKKKIIPYKHTLVEKARRLGNNATFLRGFYGNI